MQPNSGDQRHHVSRAINAYWILHVLQVHRGCRIERWWMCFLLYRWLSRTSMWNSMFKEKGGTLNVIVRTWRWMVLVGLQALIVSIHSQYVHYTFIVWFCLWYKWSILAWCDVRLRVVRWCIPRSILCPIGLSSEHLGLAIYTEASRDIHSDE